MFLSGEALFLGCCNDFTINQQSCRAVVVVGRDSKDIHTSGHLLIKPRRQLELLRQGSCQLPIGASRWMPIPWRNPSPLVALL